ncbi:MAG TPA: glycosyltransferase family 2 protein [Gemmatimonadales bacterium]|nr:glycosyltransferase family 2 protein [Gemmatimonadales bacterium]
MGIAVIIPAYQAAATIRDVVARTRAAIPAAEILVVDDGSTDGTHAAASGVAITHDRNLGKGAALRDGIREATARGAAVVVTIDADGQHPPEAIPRLLRPIQEGRADLVLGARKRDRAMPVSRRITNWLSATLASRIGGQPVSDAQTGFRAFTRAVAERVAPAGDRYEYEANFLLDALRAGFRVSSIEVPTIYGAPSHFRAWGDTWRMLHAFARHAGRIVLGAT